jgi:antitoxin VapB
LTTLAGVLEFSTEMVERLKTMSLSIKNKETYDLVRELAEVTGESMTEAVTEAVRERLLRVRREHDTSLLDDLRAIRKESAPLFKPPYDTADHGDLLYDELGLPK